MNLKNFDNKSAEKATSIAALVALIGLLIFAYFATNDNIRVISWKQAASQLVSNPTAIERVLLIAGTDRAVFEMTGDKTSMEVKVSDYPLLIQSLQTQNVPYIIENDFDYHRKTNWRLVVALVATALFILYLYKSKFFERVGKRVAGADSFYQVSADDYEKCRFEDIAGCEEAVSKLRRVAKWLKSPEWYERFGAKIPRGILAVGPPGTGKTLLARALATEVEGNFFSVNGSSFVEMFVGVGARRVRKLFKAAEEAHQKNGHPSIIFIDEIDAVGKKRGQGGNGSDSEREQTLNQLLASMNGFQSSDIVVMAATNRADTLDSALTRPGRFDYRVNVDLPDTFGREKIFEIHTRRLKLSKGVDLRNLAVRTPLFSGADIEQVSNEAAISAAERTERKLGVDGHIDNLKPEDMVITVHDFDVGIDYVQFGDPLLSRARSQSKAEKWSVAIHESGHCAVQQSLQGSGADPITKVTIEPRTKSLGSMQSHPAEDQYGYTEEQLRVRIMTAMGGRIAQEKMISRKDTGAANDFEQANRIARKMVMEFGMSNLGPLYEKFDDNEHEIGSELRNAIDRECLKIISECYALASSLVDENQDKIERIAKVLMKEQTILGEDFRVLWNE